VLEAFPAPSPRQWEQDKFKAAAKDWSLASPASCVSIPAGEGEEKGKNMWLIFFLGGSTCRTVAARVALHSTWFWLGGFSESPQPSPLEQA
jgi:hypothetical protein